MTSENKSANNRDAKFSLGTRDQRPAGQKRELALAASARRGDAANQGADPYNTSGSFDRKKNWERVGKR